MRVKIATFHFPKDSGIALALEEHSLVLVNVCIIEAGQGLCPQRGTHKTSTTGWADGRAWPRAHPAFGAESHRKNQDLPLRVVDGEIITPLQRGGLKSPFLCTPCTINKLPQSQRRRRSLKTATNKTLQPQRALLHSEQMQQSLVSVLP